ncbi:MULTISPECIES: hypothetical protein [Pseudomonas]|uniref:hypothetical protein n=1 Tax=Pseudomonas TaxID=286 RepID=UPI001F3A61E9|nr:MULTISPECIES: hypothetical protein [Pseudomonas]
MSSIDSQHAARLLYKAMAISANPANDPDYRHLVARFRGERMFAEVVNGVAAGMELVILDVSERGLVIAPTGRNSRFSLRPTDLRRSMSEQDKVAMVLIHLAIAAVFYPTTDHIEDEGRAPFPSTLAEIRDKVLAIANSLRSSAEGDSYAAEQLRPGWSFLLDLPVFIPGAERASMKSVEGLVRVSLRRLQDYGLVRNEGDEEMLDKTVFTPTHQLRVQLRELTLPNLFKAVAAAAAPSNQG